MAHDPARPDARPDTRPRGHAHGHGPDRRLGWAVLVNLALTGVQIIAGLVAGSLAMIADAVHNLSDALSLILALAARRIGRRPADGRMTFGYGRIEIVAALVNYVTLIVIALYLAWEGVMRFFAPQPVEGWIVVIVAGFALAVDLVTAWLTWRLSRESVNIRAAFLHNLADALGSVAVIVAGTLILLFGWWVVDPIVTLLISGYILWHGAVEIVPVVRMLMLGAPPGLSPDELRAAMLAVPGVEDVHHLHLWQLSERANSLEAHVVHRPGNGAGLRARLEAMLAGRFGITHTTLQLETPDEAAGHGGHAGGHDGLSGEAGGGEG